MRPFLTRVGERFVVLTEPTDRFEFDAGFASFAEAKAALRFATDGFDAGHDVFACGWIVDATVATEDGPWERFLPCDAPAVGTDRGFSCFFGHAHVNAETRAVEGWDYFDDDEIAAANTGEFLPTVELVPMGSGRS